jgi:hypothetical protein
MDLLAGWSDFVSTDEEEKICDAGLSAEEIGALYQQVSALLDADDEAQAVESFVTKRILPLLLR